MVGRTQGYYLIRRGTDEMSIESRPAHAPVLTSTTNRRLAAALNAAIASAGDAGVVVDAPADSSVAMPDDDGQPRPLAELPLPGTIAHEAAEFAAANMRSLHCRGAGALQSIGDMTTQVVAGVVYRMSIVVGGPNCDRPASFFATVRLDVETGNFTLTQSSEFMTPQAVEQREEEHASASSSAPSTAVIAGSVVGSVCAAALVAALAVWRRKRSVAATTLASQHTELAERLVE